MIDDLNRAADVLEAYAEAHARHVENPCTGSCWTNEGDRCDVTAAYRNAAHMVRLMSEQRAEVQCRHQAASGLCFLCRAGVE